jgi:macrolide-specific efflux system membrane fusion protein
MTASVIIQIDKRNDVLMVPTAAVQTANGNSTVRVLKNGTVTQVPVEVGISSDTDTEITSGLSEGQTVVTGTVSTTTTSSQTSSPFSGFGGRGGGFGGGAAVRGR